MLQVYGRSLMEICYLLLFYITCSVCGAQVLYLNKKRLLKYGMRVMQFSLDPKSNSATSARTHTHTTQKNTHARVLRAHFKAIPPHKPDILQESCEPATHTRHDNRITLR